MFQEFPYTDMHQLNLDWIIKIAKDFLDQYTHIQQLIEDGEQSLQDLTSDGLQQLEEKAEALQALLDAWYEEHSEDIAQQLASALQDLNDWYTEHSNDIANELSAAITAFNLAATNKSQALMDDWPADASELVNRLNVMEDILNQITEPYGYNLFNAATIIPNKFLNGTTGAIEDSAIMWTSDWIPIDPLKKTGIRLFDYTGSVSGRLYFYDSNKDFISRLSGNPTIVTTPSGAAYVRISQENNDNLNGIVNPFGVVVTQSETSSIPEYVPYAYAIDQAARDILMNKALRMVPLSALITDADNLEDNTLVYASRTYVPDHYPSFFNVGYFATITFSATNKIQLGFSAYGNDACIRACVIGTWSDWIRLSAAGANYIVNGKAVYSFTDLDNANDDTIFYCTHSIVTDHFPRLFSVGYFATIAFNANNKLQLGIDAYGKIIVCRASVSGTWSDWKQVMTESDVGSAAASSSVALFETIGCCGDSFTVGYLYNKPDSEWYDPDYVPNGEYPKIAYPTIMERLYGSDVTTYAKGGVTTGTWRTDPNCLPALLNDTAKQLYIIELGLNDKTQEIPVGVEADLDTEPAEETALGNWGAIIRAIQSHAPDAKIILMKSPWVCNAGTNVPNSYYNYISPIIETVSEHFSIPFIETWNDGFFCSYQYINGLKGLHPTAPLYAGMGKRIGELVGKCVIDNPSYFFNFYIPN